MGSDPEKGVFYTEQQKDSSSSSSTDSSSTDPSSVSSEDSLPRLQHAPHSSTPPRRGNRHGGHSTPSRRLGVIDENGGSVAPDIPVRNPNRPKKLVSFLPSDAAKFFSFSAYSRPGTDVPPPGAYDGIIGPRGEKFNDMRQNKPFNPPGQRGRRKKIYLGVILLLVLLVIILGVGLGVGLKRHRDNSSSNDSAPIDSPNIDANVTTSLGFPIGTYAIQTYLATSLSNCSSNSATWRCFPYTTYSESATLSFNTLQWRISSPSNSTLDLQISNTNPTFSYPFTNIPVTVTGTNDVRLSAFTFDYTYRKQVVPDADITGDNGATRCYFDNTRLSVKLYSDELGAGGNLQSPPEGQTSSTLGEAWPYAVEFEERIGSGPECFRYVNGQEGERVDIAAGDGDCVCGYRNFGL